LCLRTGPPGPSEEEKEAGRVAKILNLGKFWKGLAMETVGLHILWPFGLFYGYIFGNFVILWYIFSVLVT
jgi:hypothetical protein